MPQLMPLFWFFSFFMIVFMVFILLLIYYYYEVYKENYMVEHLIMKNFNWMW